MTRKTETKNKTRLSVCSRVSFCVYNFLLFLTGRQLFVSERIGGNRVILLCVMFSVCVFVCFYN